MKTVTFYTVVLSVILGFGACATAKMDKELAKQIRSDERLKIVSAKAEELIQNGLNAGDSYNEIWIRDLNTFIELACKVSDTAKIREALLTFFKFQGQDGNIVDGYVPKEKARISYNYIYSDLAPEFGAHKNTVETDQESSLIQAIAKYIRVTNDRSFLNEVIDGTSVGFGGSMTLDQMGLFPSLGQHNTVFWHWKQTPAQALENARSAQVYLTSANAISETGEIVNIDGTGNRVASMLYGHEALYIVAGVNKLAPDLASAMDRARSIAAPLNARRLQRKTPCALAEPMRCHDCNSPERICRGFVTLARPMGSIGQTHVILIEESLGY